MFFVMGANIAEKRFHEKGARRERRQEQEAGSRGDQEHFPFVI
jgi:hypothetical protein